MYKQQSTETSGINRRDVLKASALGVGAMSFGLPAMSGRAGASSHTTTEVSVPLTWGRSSESANGVATSKVLGGAVSAGFGLPIDTTQTAWNGDEYYAFNGSTSGDISPEPGYAYATWRQWNDSCASGRSDPYDETQTGNFEVRHFQATFDLPAGVSPDEVTDILLYSPEFADDDIIPINDNIYVRLNGTDVGQKGTAGQVWGLTEYGTATWLRDGKFPMTDGWYVDGSFSSFDANFDFGANLSATGNTVDLVTEEYCNWGGMTYLELKISYEESCDPCPEGFEVKFEYDEENDTFTPELEDDMTLSGLSFDSYVTKGEGTDEVEMYEPVAVTFHSDYCSLDATVKAAGESYTFENLADGTFTIDIREMVAEGETLHAISNIVFTCGSGFTVAPAE